MLTEKLLQFAAVGGEWILWGLGVLSVVSVGITAERIWWFWRNAGDVTALSSKLVELLKAGDPAGARALLQSHGSEEALVVDRCLDWYDAGSDSMANVLAATLRERRPRLEKGLVFLGTVGSNAPFVGLFGTVLGVVEAFVQLGKHQTGNMDAVMGGIGEALVATAAGILVAVPAVVAYNVFAKKAAYVEERAETLVSLAIAVRDGGREES